MVFSFQVYCLGTILSMQISFVGFQPVQSSEHMAVSRERIHDSLDQDTIHDSLGQDAWPHDTPQSLVRPRI